MIEMISNTTFQDAQQMAQQIFQMVDEDRSGDIDINELFMNEWHLHNYSNCL